MNRKFTTLAAAAAALATQPASAATFSVFTNGVLTGVRDLVFDNAAWNVDFALDKCLNVYGSATCKTGGTPFPLTQAQALSAATALDGFLGGVDKLVDARLGG